MEERPPHLRTLDEAIRRDGEAYRRLLDGDRDGALPLLQEAAALYRRSWEEAPPRSFGRLAALLKAAVLAGDADEAAAYARQAVGEPCDSPTSCYVLALAALVEDDDDTVLRAAGGMRGGGPPFERAADALAALAQRDAAAYGSALQAIVTDFEGRDAHLTGVAIADTALLLEALAAPRGLRASPVSPVLPPAR